MSRTSFVGIVFTTGEALSPNFEKVAGWTQTHLPLESWEHCLRVEPPAVWFHDVLGADGTPYRQAEVELIGRLTGK